jgi:phospholipid/cholesterol/gamma-HCH transport system permease protein
MTSVLRAIGDAALTRLSSVCRVLSIVTSALWLGGRTPFWPRTTRGQLSRQILFTGVEALRLTCLVAFLAGVSVVVQAQLWLSRLGQSEALGALLVTVVIREVGPLLVNFIVIGRSGTAVAAELASMRVHGEVRVLDAQGLDPMAYLVMPRVLGMAISVFGLAVVFAFVCLASGYASGVIMGIASRYPWVFFGQVMREMSPLTLVSMLMKTLLPGLLTGAIACLEGLSIGGAATEIPQAVTRAVVKSLAATLVLFALVTVMLHG